MEQHNGTHNNSSVTIDDLAAKVDGLATTVDTLTTRFDGLATTVDTLATRFDGLATTVDTLAMITKKGFDEVNGKIEKTATKEELTELKKELSQQIMNESQDTRDFVSKEVARASAEAMVRDRTLDDKGNTVADTLERKNVLSGEEAARIKNISPFPAVPRAT